MRCADIEVQICDYVDGTVSPARKAEVERHLGQCPACAALARDSAAALAFMERTAEVEPPPELITRILFNAPWGKGTARRSGVRRWIASVLSPVLQPRIVMGMAMTILSMSLVAKYASPVRFRATDLQPAKVWAGLEDRASRAWERTVKFYENLKFVYQIQTTLREWQQQDEEQQRPAAGQAPASPKTDERKLPVKAVPEKPK